MIQIKTITTTMAIEMPYKSTYKMTFKEQPKCLYSALFLTFVFANN